MINVYTTAHTIVYQSPIESDLPVLSNQRWKYMLATKTIIANTPTPKNRVLFIITPVM